MSSSSRHHRHSSSKSHHHKSSGGGDKGRKDHSSSSSSSKKHRSSSSRVEFCVQPPQQTTFSTIIYPTVVARVPIDNETITESNLAYVTGTAVLLDAGMNPMPEGLQTQGTSTVSGHRLMDNNVGGSSKGSSSSSNNSASLYFVFDNIAIPTGGRFHLQISVGMWDAGVGFKVVGTAVSRDVSVSTAGVAIERPSPAEARILEYLRVNVSGVNIPPMP